MKRLTLLVGVATSCLSLCLGQQKSPTANIPPAPTPAIEYSPNAWKEFSSPEGHFSILFPGTPVAKIDELQTAAGKVKSYAFVMRLPQTFYHVSYMDYIVYSDDAEFAKRSLDAGRDGMLARNKGMELLNEKQIAIGNFVGREFLIVQDRFSFGIMRTFVVRGRLYEIAMLAPLDVAFRKGRPSLRAEDRTEFFTSTASKFFDSFKVVDPAETVGEVDRMLRELKEKKKDVLIVMGSSAPPSQNPITGGVINGKAVNLVTPKYPAIARSAHASGPVSVKVLIDLEGNVAAAQVVDGHPLLRAAAIKAARESKFTPTQLDGKPVMVVGIIIYNFVAQ